MKKRILTLAIAAVMLLAVFAGLTSCSKPPEYSEIEDRFRELEHDTLTELGKQSGLVIATGGGAVTRDCNYPVLHQNGKIFFIERKLENLAREGRPLSMKTPVEELYARRIDAYRGFADATVYSNEIAEETAQKIVDEFKALTHKGKI